MSISETTSKLGMTRRLPTRSVWWAVEGNR
jgi:hypothetical protein